MTQNDKTSGAGPSEQRRLGLGVTIGFGVSMAMALLVTLVALGTLREVMRTEENARRSARHLGQIEQLRLSLDNRVAAWRAFLLSRDDESAQEVEAQARRFGDLMASIRETSPPESSDALAAVTTSEAAYHSEVVEAMKLRGRTIAALADVFDEARVKVRARRDTVEQALNTLAAQAQKRIDDDVRRTRQLEATATMVTSAAVLVLLIAALFGLRLTRELRRSLQRERELRSSAEALADEIAQQSKDVEQRLREVTAALEQAKRGA